MHAPAGGRGGAEAERQSFFPVLRYGRKTTNKKEYLESREKAEKAAIEKMIKNGKLTPEEIADCFTNFSVEDIRQMEKELMQTMKQ